MKIRLAVILSLFLSLVFANVVLAQYSYNYEEMTQEQYNALLAEWQQRLDTAKKGIAEEEAKIEQLKKEYDALQAEIDQTWQEIFQIAESNNAAYNAYKGNLEQLRDEVRAFLNLSPEEIYSKSNELNELEARLEELKKDPFSSMTEQQKLIAEIESLIEQAKEKAKTAVPPTYTVMKGDYLWKIAGKEDIYSNPMAWWRIYTSNLDQIKNPDLIYPNQVLAIPRVVGPNEHLVQKGEFLSKIASYPNVYGDSFK
ncbi:MAG TPA: LysM peptidoglycan-binding domain-containing protein, partial [Caldithrix abyssi]|nr:LysM peptidoglycan-binding domain-containing protein [Caldithrix abyssi]